MDDPVALRKHILAHVTVRYLKTARIVGLVLLDMKEEVSSDNAIARVVRDMVARGELEAAGDPMNMRSSEIRRP